LQATVYILSRKSISHNLFVVGGVVIVGHCAAPVAVDHLTARQVDARDFQCPVINILNISSFLLHITSQDLDRSYKA